LIPLSRSTIAARLVRMNWRLTSGGDCWMVMCVIQQKISTATIYPSWDTPKRHVFFLLLSFWQQIIIENPTKLVRRLPQLHQCISMMQIFLFFRSYNDKYLFFYHVNFELIENLKIKMRITTFKIFVVS